jgi:hypothetical protein
MLRPEIVTGAESARLANVRSTFRGRRRIARTIRKQWRQARPVILIPDVHGLVGRRELLRRGPSFQGFPSRLELRVGCVDVLG